MILFSFLLIGGGLLAAGLTIYGREYFLGSNVADWSDNMLIIWGMRIFGVLILLVLPVLFHSRRKGKAATMAELGRKHGGLEKVVEAIKTELRKNTPCYTVATTKTVNGQTQTEVQFDIIGNWFVAVGVGIENISEIAAILGLKGRGTLLVLEDEKICNVTFGASNWGAVFALFKQVNPHILYTDDHLTMADGRKADVKTAFGAKEYSTIIKHYQKLKGDA